MTLGEFHDVKKLCTSYPTKPLIFCESNKNCCQFIVISLFVSILFHFTVILLQLEHALITRDLLNQNPTKRIMLLYKKIVLIIVCFT